MKRLASLFVFISLFSCSEKLPKPTETGQNTFGCKINGKAWIPNGGKGFMPQKAIGGGFADLSNNGNLSIYIYTINTDGQEVELYINGQGVGIYNLDKTTGFTPNTLFPKNYGLYRKDGKAFITSTENTGKVTITKSDKPNKIISGTFEFTAGAGTEKISITHGRFDVNTK